MDVAAEQSQSTSSWGNPQQAEAADVDADGKDDPGEAAPR